MSKKLALLFIIISSCLFFTKAENSKNLPTMSILGKEYYVYEAQKGDSMYGVAKKFGWDIEELSNLNPDLKARLSKGDKVYYPTGRESNSTGDFDINEKGNIRHIVKKGETVYSLSRLYDMPVNIIYEYNPGSEKGIKAGDILELPQLYAISEVKTSEVRTDSNKMDNNSEPNGSARTNESVYLGRDTYTESLNSFIDSETTEVAGIVDEDVEEIEINQFDKLKIALLLDDPTSNKDIDFTRGMLISIAKMKAFPVKLDLKVMDGRVSSGDVKDELDNYEPNLIISTADRAFPMFLADYGNTNDIPVLNVFDLRNELYLDNGSMIQLFPSSSIFNEKVAKEIYNKNRLRKLIMVGDADTNDGISNELINLYQGGLEKMSLEEFGSFEPDLMEPVLIYSFANKKEEVSDFLNNMEVLSDNYPGFDYHIIGKSSWITMTDDFGDKFEDYKVYIPSRAWIDEENSLWKDFVIDYEEMFEGKPVRSIPNYTASGYDIGAYFIPMLQENQGEINKKFKGSETNLLQTDFILEKIDNGGYINTVAYLIRFLPEGQKDKIIIK